MPGFIKKILQLTKKKNLGTAGQSSDSNANATPKNAALNDSSNDLPADAELMAVDSAIENSQKNAKDERKSLLANISTEMRTPLTLILSPLESLVMGEHGSLNSEQSALLRTIHGSSVKLLQIASGLLDFSNLQPGSIEVARQPADVGGLVGTVVSEFASNTASKDVLISYDPESVHLIVSIDRYLFERIISYLIASAVKNSQAGSKVEVKLRHENARLILSVRHTDIKAEGSGSAASEESALQSRKVDSGELGLEVVQECSALLDGAISTSRSGPTTTITVDLLAPIVVSPTLSPNPVAYNQLSESRKLTLAPYDERHAASKLLPRVLIAENSAELADYIQGLLSSLCNSKVAADGETALQLVREWNPDLILAAVMLPKRDGLSLCREVKSRAETSTIPVVLLTALTQRQSMLQGWEAGADEYLFKPFHPAELVTRIRSLLRSVQQRKRAQEQIERLNEALEKRVIELANANRELKSLASKLEQARDQALEASRFKSAFLANMSHEIRTPINGVISMSDMLMRTRLNNEQVEIANIIKDSAASLLDIINDILDFSKIEAGKIELEIVDFELLHVVEGTAELVAEQAHQKKLSLMTFVAPDVPATMRGDPGRLRQILLNLLSNAIKFTDSGEVLVHATLDARDEKRCRVRFSVTDTGIGMPQETVYRLFQPFTQADGSITRRYGGTGLGLSIAKLLVELLGGRIGVRSTEGKGSTFWFSVPLDRSALNGDAPKTRQSLLDTKILVVDALEGASKVIQDYAGSWQMSCTTATSGHQALTLLRDAANAGKPFDIVMVDLFMNDMHGFDFSKTLQEDELIKDTKLILCTADDKERLGEAALQAGFSAYLIKPLRQSRLYDCIALVLDPENATLNGAVPYQPPRLTTTSEINAFHDTGVILIAEDNPVNQKVALLLLKELGFSAHVVSSGREAVDAVNRAPYALILMDCQMPEMDGFEATNAIRRAESLTGRHIPIIAMTAHAMQGDREKCIAAGMDDYVSKPVTAAKVKEVLVRWFKSDSSAWRGVEDISAQLGGAERVVEEINAQRVSGERGVIEGDAISSEQLLGYEALKHTCGVDGAAELIGVFISSTDTLMERLSKGIEESNSKAVKACAHEMKGATASMGSTAMSSTCKELEKAALADDWKEVAILFSRLTKTYALVQEYCQKLLDSSGTSA